MALGFTHLLTKISIRNLPGGKAWPARKADNLTVICESIFQKMLHPTTLWTSTACCRDSFTFLLIWLFVSKFYGFWAGHIARMGDVRSAYDILVYKLKGEISVECLCLYGRFVLNTEIIKGYGGKGTLYSSSFG
jgi:hypothetical protein